jgi:hypothetical protein
VAKVFEMAEERLTWMQTVTPYEKANLILGALSGQHLNRFLPSGDHKAAISSGVETHHEWTASSGQAMKNSMPVEGSTEPLHVTQDAIISAGCERQTSSVWWDDGCKAHLLACLGCFWS